MRVVIINLGGNQGKTTLALHFLQPRIGGCKILAVESVNQAPESLEVDVEKVRGEDFKKIYRELVVSNDLIVDVGASNVEAFLEGLSSFDCGYDEVDLFVIPVTQGAKEQKEAVMTALALSGLGVDADRIRLVFNRVKRAVDDEFPEVIAQARRHGCFAANLNCIVFENDIYADLSELGLSIDDACELAEHSMDRLKDEVRAASRDPGEFYTADKRLNVAKKARRTRDQLDAAFIELLGGDNAR